MKVYLVLNTVQLLLAIKELSKKEQEKLIEALNNEKKQRLEAPPTERELGKYDGQFHIADDFNLPVDDMNDYMK